ncbi:cytochrome P450 [Thozetella sp. PMI_491]|nr:cytochrome P450 [Thozetella sp. PMI_491]
MLSRAFSPLGVTTIAAVEALLVPRLWPGILEHRSLLSLISIIFSINYAVLGAYYLVIYPLFLSPLRHLSGPKTFFTLAPRNVFGSQKLPGELFLDIMQQYPGQEVILLNTFRDEILITGAQPLADVLVRRPYDFAKPEKIRSFLKHILGDGLIIVEEDRHKFLRKNSQPAFSFRHIKDLYPMMWRKAIKLTAALKEDLAENAPAAENGEISGKIELGAWASKATLDIIGIAGLGREFNLLGKAEDPLLMLYGELLEPDKEKLLFFLASVVFGLGFVRLLPWKMSQGFNDITTSLRDLCRPLMRDKREAIRQNENNHFDIISLLIKSDNFSDEELTDQLLTYLAAGHETTSSALSWTCYLLAKYQEVQSTVRQEVRAAIRSGASIDSQLDYAATLEQLPYLNGVINETLRLYPTVPITMRESIRDTEIAGHRIPKGTNVVLSPWAMNRSTDIWGPDAGDLVPERWITDGKPNQTGNASSNYHFLTFLHGPRSCIGQGFAKAELRCLLAAMISSFEWELGMDDAEVIPAGVITIKPASGMYLNLRALES